MGLVQSAFGFNQSLPSLSVTFASPVTVGNIIVVSIQFLTTGGGWNYTVTSVTDNMGGGANTYTKNASVINTGGIHTSAADSEVWSTTVVSGGSGFSVTAYSTALTQDILSMAIYEVSGCTTTGLVSSTGQALTDGSVTQAYSVPSFNPAFGAFVVASISVDIGAINWSAGSGYLSIESQDDSNASMYQPSWGGGSTTAPASSLSGLTGYPWSETAVAFPLSGIQGSAGVQFSGVASANQVSVSGSFGVSAAPTSIIPFPSLVHTGIDEQGNVVIGNIDQLGNTAMSDGLTSVGRRYSGLQATGASAVGTSGVSFSGNESISQKASGTASVSFSGSAGQSQSPAGTASVQMAGTVTLSASVQGTFGVAMLGSAASAGGATTTGAASVAFSGTEVISQPSAGTAGVQFSGTVALSPSAPGTGTVQFSGKAANSVSVGGSFGISAVGTASLTLSALGSFGVGFSASLVVSQVAAGSASVSEQGTEGVSGQTASGEFATGWGGIAQSIATFFGAIESKTLPLKSPEQQNLETGETG